MSEYLHPAWKHIPKQLWDKIIPTNPRYNSFNSNVVVLGEQIRSGNLQYQSRSEKTDLNDLGNEFVGDVFEAVLGEHYLRERGPHLGINGYRPTLFNDWGVDGEGINKAGEPTFVQLKFRSDATKILTCRDGLDNFVEECIWKGIDVRKPNSILIITNANTILWKDYLHRWKRVVSFISPNESWGLYEGKKYTSAEAVRVESLRQSIDGDTMFWTNLRKVLG